MNGFWEVYLFFWYSDKREKENERRKRENRKRKEGKRRGRTKKSYSGTNRDRDAVKWSEFESESEWRRLIEWIIIIA